MYLGIVATWALVGLTAGSLAGSLIRPGGYGLLADLRLVRDDRRGICRRRQHDPGPAVGVHERLVGGPPSPESGGP